MNILFDINHPAHVHLFKNAINILKRQGHHVTITARDKDVTLDLLKQYQLSHTVLTKTKKGILGLGLELLCRQLKLFFILRKQKINVCISATGACSVHVCKLLHIPSLVFYDTEHATLQNMLTIPFATKYFTPDCYQKPLTKNQITYASVHELAYLHPKYFTPDPTIFDLLQIEKNETFVILRFVSWNASHDVGQKGLSLELKRTLIQSLLTYTRMFIVSEGPLDAEFESYRLTLPADKVHDALYYATLFVGEGATMASECACLGTPAIYVNSLKLGYISEESEKYGLVFDLENNQDIIDKATEIVQEKNNNHWKTLRNKFINDKIDLTAFMIKQALTYDK